jgi:hypothetical protein
MLNNVSFKFRGDAIDTAVINLFTKFYESSRNRLWVYSPICIGFPRAARDAEELPLEVEGKTNVADLLSRHELIVSLLPLMIDRRHHMLATEHLASRKNSRNHRIIDGPRDHQSDAFDLVNQHLIMMRRIAIGPSIRQVFQNCWRDSVLKMKSVWITRRMPADWIPFHQKGWLKSPSGRWRSLPAVKIMTCDEKRKLLNVLSQTIAFCPELILCASRFLQSRKGIINSFICLVRIGRWRTFLWNIHDVPWAALRDSLFRPSQQVQPSDPDKTLAPIVRSESTCPSPVWWRCADLLEMKLIYHPT